MSLSANNLYRESITFHQITRGGHWSALYVTQEDILLQFTVCGVVNEKACNNRREGGEGGREGREGGRGGGRRARVHTYSTSSSVRWEKSLTVILEIACPVRSLQNEVHSYKPH